MPRNPIPTNGNAVNNLQNGDVIYSDTASITSGASGAAYVDMGNLSGFDVHRAMQNLRANSSGRVRLQDSLSTIDPFEESTEDTEDNYDESAAEEENAYALRLQTEGLTQEQVRERLRTRRRCRGCNCCGLQLTDERIESFRWQGDYLYCNGCFAQNFGECNMCHETTYAGNLNTLRNQSGTTQHFCNDCINIQRQDGALFQCRNCSMLYNDQNTGFVLADRCHECTENVRQNGDICYRKYRKDPALISTKSGKKITSNRPFGIELEAVFKSGSKASKASFDLPAYVGVAQDGSIEAQNGAGLEIQTPPASGEHAEQLIEKACSTLVKNGFIVNKSCGYHLHMDVSKIDTLDGSSQVKAVKALWLTYMAFEDVILSFLPASRRKNVRYCMPLKAEYNADEIIKARNMDDLEALWYRMTDKMNINRAKTEHRHASRYRGINLHPLFGARHIEIRYHSGTLNVQKILEWAQLHTRIADWAMSDGTRMDWSFYKEGVNSIEMDKKTGTLFQIAGLSAESMGYFRARQETFKAKENIVQDDHFKSGMKILQDEQEN